MTVPFAHLVVVKAPHGGWVFKHRSSGDPKLAPEAIDLTCCAQQIPNFRYFASSTTAGFQWSDHVLAFITTITEADSHGIVLVREVVVLCTWWGYRLVIDLENKNPVEGGGIKVMLAIKEFALRGLEDMVTGWENSGSDPNYPWQKTTPSDSWVYPTSFAHHVGLLQIEEATEWLLKLEAIDPSFETSLCSSDFGWYSVYGVRRAAQIALRRIGKATPRGLPSTTFRPPIQFSTNAEEELAFFEACEAFKTHQGKHCKVVDLRCGMSAISVARILGAPDFVGRAPFGDFWRYDIDKSEGGASYSYTLLVWLSKSKHVDKAVRFSPPLWSCDIDSLFVRHSARDDSHKSRRLSVGEGPVVGADGDTVYAYCHKLENSHSFQGHKDTLDLASIATSDE